MERITRVRAIALLLAFAMLLSFYGFKLYDLQVIETGNSKDNLETFTTLTRVKAARGDILDRNGNLLVSNRASYDLVFNHYVLRSSDDPNGSLLELVQLCRELDIEYIDHFPITPQRPFEYTLGEQSSAWQGYFQAYLAEWGNLDSDITAPLLIQRLRANYDIPGDWSDDDARAVIGLRYEMALRADITNLSNYVFIEDASDEDLSAILELNTPGLKAEASTVRQYHTSYAAHILGNMGAMDEDQWEYYQDLGYAMDAVVGQSGFEAAFEEYLAGHDGWRVDEVLTDGTIVSQHYQVEPQSGNNVETTIDLDLQIAAEEALAKAMQDLKNPEINKSLEGIDAEGAAVVVMDTRTGQILACASYPTFDLANFIEKYDEIEAADYAPMFNRALLGTYPPGSTYKMTTLIAAIDSGVISSGDIINATGIYTRYEADGFTPACMVYNSYGGSHGPINAEQALMVSCNYYFYTLGDKLTLSALDSTAKAMGLGEPTGVELYEETGYRANEQTKELFYEDSGWYQGDQILAAIGQSENQFTPLQLCVYASTLANKGVRYKATFLNRVVSADYRSLLVENEKEIASTLTISDEAYNAYIAGMKAVVYEYQGTANDTPLGNYPIPVAAKTGTADHTGVGSANGSFLCFAPADSPEIAIAVYGEKIAHGPNVAVVAKEILDVYFDVDEVGDVVIYENQIG